MGRPHHAYSLHTAAGKAALNNAQCSALPVAGVENPVSSAHRFLGTPTQQVEPALRGRDFRPPPLPGRPHPSHSLPRRPELFSGLTYSTDFLFRSFTFLWERLWRRRKKRLLSPGSRSMPPVLGGSGATTSLRRDLERFPEWSVIFKTIFAPCGIY